MATLQSNLAITHLRREIEEMKKSAKKESIGINADITSNMKTTEEGLTNQKINSRKNTNRIEGKLMWQST